MKERHLFVREIKRDARRNNPLQTNGAFFYFAQDIEPVLGNISFAGQHLANVRGLIGYACKFANREELAFMSRYAKATEKEIERVRDEIRGLLCVAVHGPKSKSDPDLVKQPDELLQAILERTQAHAIEWKMSLDRGGGWRAYGVVGTPDGFVAVLMALLLDPAHREMFSQCRNKTCSHFFLIEMTGGRARSRYCSKTCRQQADISSSAARQRVSYKRRRAAALLIQKYGRIADEVAVNRAVRAAVQSHPEATPAQVAEFARKTL